jgi:hypothetical protein
MAEVSPNKRPQLEPQLRSDDEQQLIGQAGDSGIEAIDGASLTSESSVAGGSSSVAYLGDNWYIVSHTRCTMVDG